MAASEHTQSKKLRRTTYPLAWDQPVAPKSEEAAKRLVLRCVDRRPIMLAALRQSGETESRRTAMKKQRRYLRSPSAKIAETYLATKKKLPDAYKEQAHGFWIGIVDAAISMNAWTAAEPAIATLKDDLPKPRWVHASKRDGYAVQRLVMSAASALARLHPRQFMSSGGLPALERWLSETLPTASLVVTTDVPSCFDAVRRTAVEAGLPLPKQVTKEALFQAKERTIFLASSPSGLVVMTTGQIAEVSSPKRGIPPGSAPSTLASEVVLREVLLQVENAVPGVQAASHNDNLMFVLQDASQKASVVQALTSAVAERFGLDVIGELTRRIVVSKPGEWFTFCGRDYRWTGKKLRWRPNLGRVHMFEIKTAIRIQEARAAKSVEALQAVGRSIKGWTRYNEGSLRGWVAGTKLLLFWKAMIK